MSDEQFRAMLEIHTVVPFRVLRAAAPYLRDAGKADREWGAFRVNVNAVAFGFVETRLTAASDDAGGGETFVQNGQEIRLGIPEKMRQLAPTIIPLGRPATAEDAAGPIFFLCSPWSDFVHGQVLTASGGQTTGMTT